MGPPRAPALRGGLARQTRATRLAPPPLHVRKPFVLTQLGKKLTSKCCGSLGVLLVKMLRAKSENLVRISSLMSPEACEPQEH